MRALHKFQPIGCNYNDIYRVSWPLIKINIMCYLQKFHSISSQSLQCHQISHGDPAPKSEAARHTADFRPICLVHSFGKLVAELLANRVQPLMPQLIENYQNVVIKGRCIYGYLVCVQGIAKSLHEGNILSLLVKPHISKAFNFISWEFLLQLLEIQRVQPLLEKLDLQDY